MNINIYNTVFTAMVELKKACHLSCVLWKNLHLEDSSQVYFLTVEYSGKRLGWFAVIALFHTLKYEFWDWFQNVSVGETHLLPE